MSNIANKPLINGLSITERYSFRGRRKYNESADKEGNSGIEKCDTLTESKLKISNQSNEESTSNSLKTKKRALKADDRVSKVNFKKDQSKRAKNNKAKLMDKSDDIDIENCDQVLKTNQEEEKVKWVPENWEEMLKNIREMRKNETAPVDSMGCHKTMDNDASIKDQRYHALISLMLSSQTKDQITYATMLKLREHGLTVDNIIKTDETTLANLIKSVGFWRTKAKHIKLTTQILKDEYDGDIPDTVEKMLKLPGVGPKMAHLCMASAWGKVHGIGVDTHVHRISNRLKWVPTPTSNPEQTRKALERWLPHELWYEVNHLMVGFGQQICLPVNPKCSECLNNKICPFDITKYKKSKKRKN